MTRSVRFDSWVWDPNTLELRNGSRVVSLEPRVAKLFEYMVAHPGELLSRDHLVDAVWDGRAVSDDAVRQAVFNLRQALAFDGADSYIRTIHKKGYVATFPNPVSMEHEAFDSPPDASATMTTSDEATPTPNPVEPISAHPGLAVTSRRLVLVGLFGAAILVTAVLMRLYAVWEPAPIATSTKISVEVPARIAVLPIINFSNEGAGQFLADGLTEELFGILERNRELRVTARSSTFQFRDQQRDVRDLGRRLGVHYILEGDVRSNEKRLLVQGRLVDAESGEELWTQTYEHTLSDWFELQQEVAVDVARAIQFAIQQGDEAVPRPSSTISEEAQLELLRARQLLITRSVADAEQAIEHLQRALTLDPNYALAYARLADAILIQADSTTGIKAARTVVTPLLDKALAIDPGLGEAYALRSMLSDDPAAAARDLRRGLELNPSYARGYEMLANLQSSISGQMDLAVSSIDSAIALDPLTPGNLHSKAMLMMTMGDWQEAVNLDTRALGLNPEFRAALVQIGMASGIQGHFAEAVDYAERAVALDPRAVPLRSELMIAYLAVGDVESARAVNTPPTPLGQLIMLWSAGDISQAADMIYSRKFGQLEKLAPEMVSQIVLLQALSDGDFARALTLLSGAIPFNDTIPAENSGWWLYAYANLKQLLDANGDVEEASRLQTQMEAQMGVVESRYPRYALIHDQVRATLLAQTGHAEEACAALERVYTPAPRLFWWMVLSNPAFDSMRAMPCFTTLRTRLDAHVAAERERVENMRRVGQIPNRSTAHLDRSAGSAIST